LDLIVLLGEVQGRPRQRLRAGLDRARRRGSILHASGAMVAAHRAPRDSVDPASQRFGVLDGVETSVDHDEHLLDDIVHGGLVDAKTANRRPNEVEVLPVNGYKRRDFARYKG